MHKAFLPAFITPSYLTYMAEDYKCICEPLPSKSVGDVNNRTPSCLQNNKKGTKITEKRKRIIIEAKQNEWQNTVANTTAVPALRQDKSHALANENVQVR